MTKNQTTSKAQLPTEATKGGRFIKETTSKIVLVPIQSKSSFFHLLSESYTSTELSILYLKYKEGTILEKELDDPRALVKYLAKSSPKNPSPPKVTAPTFDAITKSYFDLPSSPTALSAYVDDLLNLEANKSLKVLRDRWLEDIPKLDPEDMSEKLYSEDMSEKLEIYWGYDDLEVFVNGAKANPKLCADKLVAEIICILGIIDMKNKRPPNLLVKIRTLVAKLLLFEEYDLVYYIYKKVADKGYGEAMYELHNLLSNFDSWAKQKVGPKEDLEFEILRWLVRSYQYMPEISEFSVNRIDESGDYLASYEDKYEELENKNQELEAKIKALEADKITLESKVLHLTYRPGGGPGFSKVQARGIKNGMKK